MNTPRNRASLCVLGRLSGNNITCASDNIIHTSDIFHTFYNIQQVVDNVLQSRTYLGQPHLRTQGVRTSTRLLVVS